MSHKIKRWTIFPAALASLLLAITLPLAEARAAETRSPETRSVEPRSDAAFKEYPQADVARLSQVVDEVYVLGKGDVDWSFADPNLALEKGDMIQTGEAGMAELQFDDYLVLRVGANSRAALVETGVQRVIGVERGSVYLRVAREVTAGEELILTFPGGQLAVVGRVLARLDIADDGSAQLRVVRGSIGLATKSEEARSVTTGSGVLIDAAGKIEAHSLDMARGDGFEKWNTERDIALSTYKRPEQVEENVVGAEELDGYGEWVTSETYETQAWRPYVVETWKPYSQGRWYYSEYYGWTWTPEEPWGYATHHYGSWNYDPYYRWVWIPGSVWHPARVEWVTSDEYIGWVPIGYYGYPVAVAYPYYVVNPHSHFWNTFTFTFVAYGHFYYHHGHHRHHGHGHHGHHDDWGHRDGDDGKRFAGDTKREKLRNVRDSDDINLRKGMAKRRRDSWKSTGGLIGDTKREKLRYIRDSKDLNLKRNTIKGRVDSWNTNYEGSMDFAKHPELRKKTAKLRRSSGSADALASSAAFKRLPRKASRDNARSLDFRERGKKIGKADIKRAAPLSGPRRDTSTGSRYERKWSDYRKQVDRDRRSDRDQIGRERGGRNNLKQARNASVKDVRSTRQARRITVTQDDIDRVNGRSSSKKERFARATDKRSRTDDLRAWDSRERKSRTASVKRAGTDSRQTLDRRGRSVNERVTRGRKADYAAPTSNRFRAGGSGSANVSRSGMMPRGMSDSRSGSMSGHRSNSWRSSQGSGGGEQAYSRGSGSNSGRRGDRSFSGGRTSRGHGKSRGSRR